MDKIVKLLKIGKGQGVNISPIFLKYLNWSVGDKLNIEVKKDRIIITKKED